MLGVWQDFRFVYHSFVFGNRAEDRPTVDRIRLAIVDREEVLQKMFLQKMFDN